MCQAFSARESREGGRDRRGTITPRRKGERGGVGCYGFALGFNDFDALRRTQSSLYGLCLLKSSFGAKSLFLLFLLPFTTYKKLLLRKRRRRRRRNMINWRRFSRRFLRRRRRRKRRRGRTGKTKKKKEEKPFPEPLSKREDDVQLGFGDFPNVKNPFQKWYVAATRHLNRCHGIKTLNQQKT